MKIKMLHLKIKIRLLVPSLMTPVGIACSVLTSPHSRNRTMAYLVFLGKQRVLQKEQLYGMRAEKYNIQIKALLSLAINRNSRGMWKFSVDDGQFPRVVISIV